MKARKVKLTDEEHDSILAAGRLTSAKSHHGPPGGDQFMVPQLYHMSARGDTVLLFISYHMVFFVMGVAGWACYYFLKPPASGVSPSCLQHTHWNTPVLESFPCMFSLLTSALSEYHLLQVWTTKVALLVCNITVATLCPCCGCLSLMLAVSSNLM
jgi:hypothetical protein